MCKQYIIKYRIASIPWEFEFMAIEDTADKAITAFIREYPIGITSYRIAAVLDI